MKTSKISDYEILLPPYKLDYDSWTCDEAQAYLDWFVSQCRDRAAYVFCRAVPRSGATLKLSPDVLEQVWTWFLRTAEIEAVPQQEQDIQRVKFGHFGESFISKVRLSIRTEYIIRDIAMLMSLVFTANHRCLYWGFDAKPKRYIFYNHPVLKGFLDTRYAKPFAPVFEPVHMVGVQAAKYLDGTGRNDDLINLYQHWEQHIPTSK